MEQAPRHLPAPSQRSTPPPIPPATAFSSRLICLLRASCAPGCMERRSFRTASGKRFSFRNPRLFLAVRWFAYTFSTLVESRNSAMSPWARRKATLSKFCPVSRLAKDLLTHPLTSTLPASALRSSHEARAWNRRAHGALFSQLQVNAAVYRRVAGRRNLCGGDHSA